MRAFNKLFVVALPRCATVSMHEALGLMGIPTAHLGKIYGEPGQVHYHAGRLAEMLRLIKQENYRWSLLEECRGLVDYPACCLTVLKFLDVAYPGSLFINVQRERSLSRWLQSVESQFVGLDLLGEDRSGDLQQANHVMVMRSFRELTFGTADFQADIYERAYRDFQNAVDVYFKNRDDYLTFNDVGDLAQDGFPRLAEFLQIDPPPNVAFPRSNAHSQLPESVFQQALRSGRIVSQTGLT